MRVSAWMRCYTRLLLLISITVELDAFSIRQKFTKRLKLQPKDKLSSKDVERKELKLGSNIPSIQKKKENKESYDLDVINPYSEEANQVNVDELRAQAGKLRATILQQQLELQKLERKIVCCSSPPRKGILGLYETADSPFEIIQSVTESTLTKLTSSTNVLVRKLGRVQSKTGIKNQNWSSVGEYVAYETAAGARIVSKLVRNPESLLQLVDPETPTLAPHIPAILTRLDQLENHVNPILEKVLNNKRHLPSIEPYLDEVLERFDDIEPHLPWILKNIDVLAPYTGLLLKHIDDLLLYADVDEDYEADFEDGYDMAEQLLPYLEYYVSRLDIIGPHLPLLRPHVPLLLKYNRIGKVSPHIDRLFAKGYSDLSASANIDVLLFWFGWTLRIPGLPRLFFALPKSPRIVSFLANRLPKRFIRGYCNDVSCVIDNDYGANWNKLSKD